MKQYTVTVFESAAEYFDACPLDDAEVYIVLDGNIPSFSGKESEKYKLCESVTEERLIKEAFSRAGGKAHLT